MFVFLFICLFAIEMPLGWPEYKRTYRHISGNLVRRFSGIISCIHINGSKVRSSENTGSCLLLHWSHKPYRLKMKTMTRARLKNWAGWEKFWTPFQKEML